MKLRTKSYEKLEQKYSCIRQEIRVLSKDIWQRLRVHTVFFLSTGAWALDLILTTLTVVAPGGFRVVNAVKLNLEATGCGSVPRIRCNLSSGRLAQVGDVLHVPRIRNLQNSCF